MGNLILGRGLAASAQVDNDVWIIGGRTYWGIVPHVEKYSLDTNHTVIDSDWMMPTPVSNAGAASIGTKIYVVGGATEDPVTGNAIPVANLQIFDTATQTWDTTGPPLPKALMQCAVTSLGGKLYVFGGLKSTGTNSYAAVTDAYVYDPVTNAWSSLAVLPTATAYAAVAPTARERSGSWAASPAPARRLSRDWCRSTIPPRTNGPRNFTWSGPGAGPPGSISGARSTACAAPSHTRTPSYDEYADGEWYNPAWGYWMPSIMNYLGIFVSPPNVLARSGLYTPSAGQYQDNIYLLGGVTGTDSTYKYSYSNKVWAFPAPSQPTSKLPIVGVAAPVG